MTAQGGVCQPGTSGSDCPGGDGDCCSGYYCTSASKCCETSQFWNGISCEDTTECYDTPCIYAPFSSGWWQSDNCMDYTKACCEIGPAFGGVDPFYYYTTESGASNIQTY